jgi:hypothetical protein
MALGTVVAAWQDATTAHLAVRVGEVEYIGSVALGDLAGMSAAQRKAALVGAVKAARDREVGSARSEIAISGTVTV